MSLHWVFGGSGSGKSYYLYHKVMAEASKEPATGFIIIVPEQFTMQTQKDMVMLSSSKSIMNIDVLSFMRLAYRVLEETPALEKPVLEDEGKGMVIRRILREHADEWKTFGSNINKAGFVEEIKSIITEFLQYRVDESSIDELQESSAGRQALASKLIDLELVFRYYKEYMDKRYISVEEILTLLADYASSSDLLKNCVMFIDGFTGFTPVQYTLLRELLKVCRDVYITVTIDRDADPFMPSESFDLFHMSKCFIKKCMQAAKDSSVTADDVVWTGRKKDGIPWRFINNPELALLEKNLFRLNTDTSKNINDEVNINEESNSNGKTSFHLYESYNPYEEVSFCTWKLRQIIRKEGLRYRDVAIVTGNVDLYGRLFENELEAMEVPCFLDNSRSILDNAFVDMILAAFGVVSGGFTYNYIMRFVRNGMVRDYLGFDNEGSDFLDNFILATGIKGASMWKKDWYFKNKKSYNIEAVNEYRKKLADLLLVFDQKVKICNTVLDYSRALYEFISDNNMSEYLLNRAEKYEAQNKPIEKKEYEQVYKIVINLLDQMVELMGDEKVSCKDYIALLTTGFSEASVGVIPPGVDSVIIGDIQRTRLKDIRVLFFVGVNDGVIPKAVKTGGFLSDMEREFLLENGAELAPTVRERIFTERFYLYLMVTKPSELLYVTYSRKSCSGGELEASPFIRQLKDILGDVTVESNYYNWDTESKIGNDFGRTWWINGLREYIDDRTGEYRTDKRWLELHREWSSKQSGSNVIKSAFYSGESSSISKKIADILYGKEIKGSISRLECFASCAFAHFMQYGLCLRERKEYKVDIPDIGTLFHEIIERFSQRLNDKGLRWRDADDELISEWTGEVTDSICTEYGDGVLLATERSGYMKDRLERIAGSTIKALAEQMKAGQFEAKAFEISFERVADIDSLNIELDNGNTMHLVGRIDRIDACDTNDTVYIKVIDYKSGNEKFDLLKLYYGLKMQLIVYLTAANEICQKEYRNKLVVPAGAFYFHIDDPVIESDAGDETVQEMLESRIFASYKLNGPVNRKLPIPFLLDGALAGPDDNLKAGTVSSIIPAAVTKSGTYDMRRSMVVEEKDFERMQSYVRHKMQKFGNQILDGNTQISPYRLDSENPCTYCSYNAVCGFDSKLPDNNYRSMPKKADTDIMKELEECLHESK